MAHSPWFCLPLLIPLCLPLCALLDSPLLTWNPPSCDRIRPPRSQVACKLTSPDSTLSPPSPLQIPRTPNTPRLTKTTSGTTRHLLSGTRTNVNVQVHLHLCSGSFFCSSTCTVHGHLNGHVHVPDNVLVFVYFHVLAHVYTFYLFMFMLRLIRLSPFMLMLKCMYLFAWMFMDMNIFMFMFMLQGKLQVNIQEKLTLDLQWDRSGSIIEKRPWVMYVFEDSGWQRYLTFISTVCCLIFFRRKSSMTYTFWMNVQLH